MAASYPDSDHVLHVSKTLNAPIHAVYSAWTDADRVAQWFAPGDDYKTVVTQMDVRLGGGYCIEMHTPEGQIHIVSGEYVEIAEPNRLVFTWSWAHEADDNVMLVSIDLSEHGGTTRLDLLHERLPSAASRDLHNEGWAACLARLLTLMAQ